MTGNDFVIFFLRTPLRVFMGNTMLITVTGRKTGRKYATPVGYYPEGDALWVISNRDRTWWRNVRNGANVSLLLKGKPVQAFAQAELDEKEVETHLLSYPSNANAGQVVGNPNRKYNAKCRRCSAGRER